MRRYTRHNPGPADYIPPWKLTFAELLAYEIPSVSGDSSRDPSAIHEPGYGETLADLVEANDDWRLRENLGARLSDRGWNSVHLLSDIRAGRPLTIYRATDAEREIWPGAYVTLSRAYAENHGTHHLGRDAAYHVLRGTAFPSQLIVVDNGNEFWYAPDVGAWHRAQVAAAIKNRLPVPDAVRAEHEAAGGGKRRRSVRKNDHGATADSGRRDDAPSIFPPRFKIMRRLASHTAGGVQVQLFAEGRPDRQGHDAMFSLAWFPSTRATRAIGTQVATRERFFPWTAKGEQQAWEAYAGAVGALEARRS